MNKECDFLIIGSGLSGLISAIRLSKHGRVIIATKSAPVRSNTNWAQGGIACVVDADDTIESHVEDTIHVGGGLCDRRAVEAILSKGPEAIHELEALGVSFEARAGKPDEYDLGQEAGHSRRRVLHAGDVTGREIIRVLLDYVRDTPNIELLEHHMAIDLVTTGWLRLPGPSRCVGAYFLDGRQQQIKAIQAQHTILATGGAGKVYLYTSNPDVATGDGVAMAWRVGLPIKNLEFVQFHPTYLYHPEERTFLISEAVRGEGGVLINAAGERFVDAHDTRGSLAPRDVLARIIDSEIKARGDKCVYVDITHRSAEFLRDRFPNIYATCLKHGIDMAKDPIPVVPAAHYFCGGVEADDRGVTDLDGLYACGEVACTGLHGANRLASNSLLEALVTAFNCSDYIAKGHATGQHTTVEIPAWRYGDAVPSDEEIVVEHNWNEVRTCMWDYVGIVRTNKRLDRAQRRIENLRREIRQYYLDYVVTTDTLELRNIADVAELVIRSAIMRKESRGLHYTLDYPDRAPEVAQTRIVDPPGGVAGRDLKAALLGR